MSAGAVGGTGRGRFLVLEGPDGCGKTTQAALLAERLRRSGRRVVTTFEPGATPTGGRIRAIALDPTLALDPRAEALLMAADRAQHVAAVVRPALERGVDVVADRFSPSTVAYQGAGRGLPTEAVERLCRWAADGLEPDLVVLLDLADEVLDARRGRPGDRLEGEPEAFHALVRRAYREMAQRRGYARVGGEGGPTEVAERVWSAVEPVLAGVAAYRGTRR